MGNKEKASLKNIGSLTVNGVDYIVIDYTHYTDGSVSLELLNSDVKTTAWFHPESSYKESSNYDK